jgi:predicted nucleic acid-binding protein
VEVYSTLTRMPGQRRVAGEQAILFVKDIRARLTIVALDAEEYSDALHASASLGIAGGAIYDAMLAHCAVKAKAESIYTWNLRHYALCGHEVAGLLRTPSQG